MLQSVTNKIKTELTFLGELVYFFSKWFEITLFLRITFVSYIRREKNGYN